LKPMLTFWKFMYSFIAIPFLWIVLQTLGLFNAKVRRGIAGRRGLLQKLGQQIALIPPGKRIWVHSSSMGEFEQAKPIIARLKERSPDTRIIVTFYSPSGYENSKKYPLADVISYLPFDTRRNAREFLSIVNPDIALMVRYDIWPNHIWELQRRGIPSIIANATMRRQTERRVPFVRNLHYHVYNAFATILTVSKADAETFGLFRLTHPLIEVIGDTRYDQVRIRSLQARKHALIPPAILQGRIVFVVGSSWPEDEQVILPAFTEIARSMPDLLMILVPHEPTLNHLDNLEAELRGQASFIRFSALNEYGGEQVIIVDSIGILLTLYSYAHVAFVGGSFHQNVHNVLEAAVYGIPVIFGPKYRNSQEPIMLVGGGGGFIVTDTTELERTLRNLLGDESARRTAGARAARFVESNVGATDRVIEHLERLLNSKAHEGLADENRVL
jgi:3-deoxy-D-manno-octulosonic-acid transferase